MAPPAGERAVTRTGVLGGTFDPPHLAHLALAAAAKRHLALDRVVFLPAGDPWRKRSRDDLTPAETRLQLVRAAVAGLSWATVSDLELRRDGASYTAETMEELAADGGAWWFLLGEDALVDMTHWHDPARIVRAARLAVTRRDGADGPLVTDELRAAVPGIDQRIDVVPMPPLTVSSSEVRARVRRGGDPGLVVPEGVRVLIEELGLYRGDDGTGG